MGDLTLARNHAVPIWFFIPYFLSIWPEYYIPLCHLLHGLNVCFHLLPQSTAGMKERFSKSVYGKPILQWTGVRGGGWGGKQVLTAKRAGLASSLCSLAYEGPQGWRHLQTWTETLSRGWCCWHATLPVFSSTAVTNFSCLSCQVYGSHISSRAN